MCKKVAIIILQYGNAIATIECIESVQSFNTYPVKYIVVDNASPSADSVEELTHFMSERFSGDFIEVSDRIKMDTPLPYATLVRSLSNDGYARGNNKGLRLAFDDEEIDSILILNNDTLFVEDIIPKLVEDLETINDCAFITPILYKKGLAGFDVNCARYKAKFTDILLNNLLIFRYAKRVQRPRLIPDNGIIKVELISGSCMMCRKDLFRSVGGFDPGTFLYYEEDILFEKIEGLGLCNYLDTGLKCIHLGASTTKKSSSLRIVKIGLNSQYYFIKKYHKYKFIKLPLLKLSHWWVVSMLSFKNIFKWKR